MTPRMGGDNIVLFSSTKQLSRLGYRPLGGLFLRHLSRDSTSPSALLTELQIYKHTLRLGEDFLGHHQKQLTQTLIVRL